MDRIKAAKELAMACGQACVGDVDLLVKLAGKLPDKPLVIELGARSGIMPLAIYGVRPDAKIISVDKDFDGFNWEGKAIEANGINTWSYILSDSVEAAQQIPDNIDLLIVDADHTYEGVLSDLNAYKDKMNSPSYIFLHDYDGSTAPYQYPGVEQAAKEFFKKRYSYKMGWSAAWIIH